ncbi:hypothetical protein SAMN05443245_5254 [Paraburkholderia fungorum]|uniref:LysM domain-containing protein n=1 Tax=Paraburkholderia fungorum TaxID=134537 RepID=A0A1H1IJ14_9BURK|nr:hypothetical protein [Paraburkholderia fungorum]SDR37691.1 hypothetical protein SAMN05443245_5254 [Paraburkholderia fungorum]
MSDIKLILGDFTFQDMEIPESIGFGGDQRLSIKKLVGGVRVIDAMGGDARPLEWSGVFFPTQSGQSALDRAEAVQSMLLTAQPITLSWDRLQFSVFIRTFEPDYRFARIPYKIVCEVLQDLTLPNDIAAGPNADDLINGDLNSANTLTSATGDSTLSGLMSSVSTAVSNVKTFVGASLSTVASVLGPIHQAVSYVTSSIGTVDNILASVGVPAGVLPSVSVLQNVGVFSSIVNATTLQVQYSQIGALLGRMQTNLGQINSSGRVITVGGGNLFDVASKQYGDPSAWTQIAQANNLSDPTLVGVSTLIIPPYNNGASGGILSS